MSKKKDLAQYLDTHSGCSVEDAARECYYKEEYPFLEKKIRSFDNRLKKGYKETFKKNLNLDLWSAARIAMNRNTWQAMQEVRPELTAVSERKFSKASYKSPSELTPDEELQLIREIVNSGNNRLEAASMNFKKYKKLAESVADGQRTIFSFMMRNIEVV